MADPIYWKQGSRLRGIVARTVRKRDQDRFVAEEITERIIKHLEIVRLTGIHKCREAEQSLADLLRQFTHLNGYNAEKSHAFPDPRDRYLFLRTPFLPFDSFDSPWPSVFPPSYSDSNAYSFPNRQHCEMPLLCRIANHVSKAKLVLPTVEGEDCAFIDRPWPSEEGAMFKVLLDSLESQSDESVHYEQWYAFPPRLLSRPQDLAEPTFAD